VVKVVITERAGLWNWRLQVDLPSGCDVLLRGVEDYPDPQACRAALRRLGRIDQPRALSVQGPDGLWHLRFFDADGRWVAMSADRFPDARASRLRLDRLVQAMADVRLLVAVA